MHNEAHRGLSWGREGATCMVDLIEIARKESA